MKTNKEKIYAYLMSDGYIAGQTMITTQDIVEKFGLQRSNASSLLNELVKEGRLLKQKGRPVKYFVNGQIQNKEEFTNMIGHDGSLKQAIQLAKAAMLYPKKSTSVLIISKMGTGKTTLVRNMYEFAVAKKILTSKDPYSRSIGIFYY